MDTADLQVGRVYACKRPKPATLFSRLLNDRQIIWMDSLRTQVQYDSPSVTLGRTYPKVSIEAFAKWAHQDVTELMPPNSDWRAET